MTLRVGEGPDSTARVSPMHGLERVGLKSKAVPLLPQ